jgi:hypothetical protein
VIGISGIEDVVKDVVSDETIAGFGEIVVLDENAQECSNTLIEIEITFK